jgi:hypothetical protein
VVPIAPDAAASAKGAVEGTGNTDREPANAGHQRRMIVRFDDQMDMIVLNAEVDDAEARARRLSERTTHDGEDGARPKASDRRRRPKGNVHRMRCFVFWSRPVRHARTTARSYGAPGTAPSATPGASRGQCKLQRACHLDSVIIAV